MTSQRTLREMAAGAANSAKFAAIPPRRPKFELGEHVMQSVYRPPDGLGSQERMKYRPGTPGAIGHALNLFRLGR